MAAQFASVLAGLGAVVYAPANYARITGWLPSAQHREGYPLRWCVVPLSAATTDLSG
jgi:hypothetical protein